MIGFGDMEFSRGFLFWEIKNKEFQRGKESIQKAEKAVSRQRRG